jgi:hypothetical protein
MHEGVRGLPGPAELRMKTSQQGCDYDLLRKEYSWLPERKRRFVSTPDADGFLCGLVLSHALSWELVGFTTPEDLWLACDALPKGAGALKPEHALSAADIRFVGVNINRGYIRSIGHHVLQWSKGTNNSLLGNGYNALNPNILRGITWLDFDGRYPYGTVHFLLAVLSAWSLLPDFKPCDEISALMMYAGSGFKRSLRTPHNALSWLDWLGGSEVHSPLYPICRRMLRFNPRVIIEQFRNLAQRFGEWGLKPRRQAAFTDPRDRAQWECRQRLLEWVNQRTGWVLKSKCTPEARYLRFPMRRESTKPTKANFMSVIAKEPFSYAIIGSAEGGLNYNWFQGQS